MCNSCFKSNKRLVSLKTQSCFEVVQNEALPSVSDRNISIKYCHFLCRNGFASRCKSALFYVSHTFMRNGSSLCHFFLQRIVYVAEFLIHNGDLINESDIYSIDKQNMFLFLCGLDAKVLFSF